MKNHKLRLINKKQAKNKKYKTVSTQESVLNYVTDEVNLEEGQEATNITIPHSDLQVVEYVYDAENKVYKRYQEILTEIEEIKKELIELASQIDYVEKAAKNNVFCRISL